MKKIFLVLIASLWCSILANAQTLTLNDASIVNASPVRIGMNIGSIDYYDNGQGLKNLIGAVNYNMEPALTQQYFVLAQDGTTTTFTDFNQYSTVPLNYMAGATFTVVETQSGSGAELGCSGTIASNTGPNRAYATSWSISGNVLTVQAPNSFAAGNTVTLYQFGAGSFMNNQQVTVLSSGLSSTQFKASLSHADASASRDYGFAEVSSTYAYATYTVSSPCGANFKTGDQIVVSKVTLPTPQWWWESGRGGIFNSALSTGASLTSDTTDLCESCGSQALAMNSPGAETIDFDQYFDSNNDSVWSIVNGSYTLSFWAKSSSGSPILSVTAQRDAANGFNCGSTYTPTLTGTWQQFTFTCTASEYGIGNNSSATCQAGGTTSGCTQPGNAHVHFHSTGGTVYLDNTVFQKSTDINPTVFRQEWITQLQNLRPAQLRYWVNQNAENLANWTAPDYARKPSAPTYFVGPAGSATTVLSLEDYLVISQTVGADLYLEVPVTFSTSDAAGLIEFLAAPSSSSPWGIQRASLGQSAPWTSVFTNIFLSFCNECWNGGSFVYQSIPGRSSQPNSEYYYDYSVRSRDIFAAMRADPYFSSQFHLGMNLQTAVNYTADVAIARAKPDYVEIEDYTYGSVSDTSSVAAMWQPYATTIYLENFGPATVGDKNFYTSVVDYVAQNTCGASGTAACQVNNYEWGQGTIAGSLSQLNQDYVDAGAGTGIIDIISPLLHQQQWPNSFKAMNFFAFSEWTNGGTNNNKAKLWGSIVDAGGATNNVRPQFLAMSMANSAVIGPMYSCALDSSNLYSWPGNANNGDVVPPGTPAVSGVPYVYSFCFKNGTQRALLLVNTDTASSHTVTFTGTNPPAGTVIKTSYAPTSPNLLNEAPTGTPTYLTSANVSLSTTSVSSPSSVILTPFSATLLSYSTGTPPPPSSVQMFHGPITTKGHFGVH